MAREPKLWDLKRKLSVDECRKLQGFPDGFKLDVSDVQAKKQMGNSIAVPAVTAIVGKMMEAYEKYLTVKMPYSAPFCYPRSCLELYILRTALCIWYLQ